MPGGRLVCWPGGGVRCACCSSPGASLMPIDRLVGSTTSRGPEGPAAGISEVRAKPRLRGVAHQYAFFVSLGSGTLLVRLAATTRASVAAAIYAASVSALFGVSALYHRVTWTPLARRRMRRLDHAMIFLLIAGGLAYSVGAAVYALRRPDPAPAVFGYHEVFHLLVIAGVAAHFLAISR